VFRVADTALKHGCSIEEISHAYDMWRFEDYLDADSEPPKVLTIGPDHAGNLLELVGGTQPNGDYVIWHAMRCRPKYLALLQGDGR